MRLTAAAPILAGVLASGALAALKQGDKAPDFTAQAAQGGKEFTFHLKQSVHADLPARATPILDQAQRR